MSRCKRAQTTSKRGAVLAASLAWVGLLGASTALMQVTCPFLPPPPVTPITVSAGADQTVTPGAAGTVTATVGGATGIVTYQWTIVSGSIQIGNVTGATATFTAPNVQSTSSVIRVTASDSGTGTEATDEVTITTTSTPPGPALAVTASATPSAVVLPAGTTLSCLPTGGTPGYTYSWVLTSATPATIASATGQTTAVTFSGAGTYTFTVTVTDSASSSVTSAVVSVTVTGASSGLSFTLAQDNLTGSSGVDTFSAPLLFNAGTGAQIPSFQTGDTAAGGGGADVLNVTLANVGGAAQAPVATLSGIPTINITDFGGAGGPDTLNCLNITGVTAFNSVGSTAAPIILAIPTIASFGLTNTNVGITPTFVGATLLNATTDTLNLAVSGVTAGVFAYTTPGVNGFETLAITSSGATANVLTTITQAGGTSLATINIAGTQDLTVTTALDASTAALATVNAGTLSGKLSLLFGAVLNLTVTGGSGDDTFQFGTTFNASDTVNGGNGTDILDATFGSSLGPPPLSNTENFRFNATADGLVLNLTGVTGVTTLTNKVDGTSNTVTVTGVAGFPALVYRGTGAAVNQVTDTITYVGANTTGTGDTVAISVNNRGTAVGVGNSFTIGGAALTINGVENVGLTIADGNATVTTGITDDALKNLTLTANANLALGTVTVGTDTMTSVNALAVTGDLTAIFPDLATNATVTLGNGSNTVSVAGSLGCSITGGSGTDAITGSAAADVISGGGGNDTLIGGTGIDTLTGGNGSDTFGFDANIAAANAKTATDFVAGAGGDVLRFSAAAYTDFTAGAAVTFALAAAATADGTGGADNIILRDTTANIAAYNSAGAGATIAIDLTTGNIIYDANGDFTAGSVIVGSIPPAQVANLVGANILIAP